MKKWINLGICVVMCGSGIYAYSYFTESEFLTVDLIEILNDAKQIDVPDYFKETRKEGIHTLASPNLGINYVKNNGRDYLTISETRGLIGMLVVEESSLPSSFSAESFITRLEGNENRNKTGFMLTQRRGDHPESVSISLAEYPAKGLKVFEVAFNDGKISKIYNQIPIDYPTEKWIEWDVHLIHDTLLTVSIKSENMRQGFGITLKKGWLTGNDRILFSPCVFNGLSYFDSMIFNGQPVSEEALQDLIKLVKIRYLDLRYAKTNNNSKVEPLIHNIKIGNTYRNALIAFPPFMYDYEITLPEDPVLLSYMGIANEGMGLDTGVQFEVSISTDGVHWSIVFAGKALSSI